MPTFSTHGIIINKRDFMESDRIVTILSPIFGKIEAVAKGSRKITSRKSSNIEIFNYGTFSFAKGKNLDIMTESQILDQISLDKESQNLPFIFYFCELVDKSTIPSIEYASFFSEILKLRTIFRDYKDVSILMLQILILKEFGAFPDLRNCISSGESLEKLRFYDEANVGYTSESASSKDFTQISDRVLKIQLFLSENSVEKTNKLNLTTDDFSIIFRIQNNWIENSLDRKIKSYEIIKRLIS